MPDTKRARAARSEKRKQRLAENKLAAKRERFCQEYLVDLNGSAAARRAGYAARSAGVEACELLKLPEIKERIEQLMAERTVRTQITQDRVLHELAIVGFSNVDHYRIGDVQALELDAEAPPAALRAVASVKHRTRTEGEGDDASVTREVEFRLWDKVGALTKLGQHLGLFKDRVEVTGKDGGPVKHEVTKQVWQFGDKVIEF